MSQKEGFLENAIERMKELIEIMEPAAKAYYSSSVELMTNYEYDKLYSELETLEKTTGIILSGSLTQKVGFITNSSLQKKKHIVPMLSLNKTKLVEDLVEKAGDQLCWLSWKMDGLTVVLTYENGILVEALTRGDGEIGEIITENAKRMKGIPLTIPDKGKKVVRGEAVISNSTLKKINRELPKDKKQYENCRNLCAGTIRNLNPQVVSDRNVKFFAFEYVEGAKSNSHFQTLVELKKMGFNTVSGKLVKKSDIPDAIKWFAEEIKTYDYPSDGLVLMYDDIAYGKSLGVTNKYPRKGLAFKWKDEEVETNIIEVDWGVSRNQILTPVAVFTPIELEGSTVSRASLHNLSIFKKFKIGVGDTVKVIKANMIIPQIVENVTKSNNIEIPSTCPICGAPTKIRVDEKSKCEVLYCTGTNCISSLIKKIDHFCSRDAMNISGLSEKTIEAFVSEGIISSPLDIFKLENFRETIVEMEGFGTKSFENLINAINKSKHVDIHKFLYSLGIPNFGSANCKTVCKELKFESIYDFSSVTKDDLSAIDGIGEVMALSFVDYFKNEKNLEFVKNLSDFITLKKPEEEVTDGLKDMTFVITGTLEKMSRKELQELIEKNGGKVSGTVSAKTTALINNDSESDSKKNKTAKSLGVKILTEEDFYQKYNLH